MIFNGCQKLESIRVNCGEYYLNESNLLQTVAKCSPKNFFKLKIFWDDYEDIGLELFSEELEPVFTSWANRFPQKSLYLILEYPDGLKVKKESMETIEKFKTLGVIKFKILLNG